MGSEIMFNLGHKLTYKDKLFIWSLQAEILRVLGVLPLAIRFSWRTREPWLCTGPWPSSWHLLEQAMDSMTEPFCTAESAAERPRSHGGASSAQSWDMRLVWKSEKSTDTMYAEAVCPSP